MDRKDIISAQSSQITLNKAFLECCKTGDLDGVRYMLTSTDVQIRPDFTYPDDRTGHDGLSYAGVYGNLDIIKYLLFSPELKNNDYYAEPISTYLHFICHNEQFHVADFLVEKKIFDPLKVFTEILFHENKFGELAHYLIINCDIPITPEVKKVIDCSTFIAEIFEKRELNKELKSELQISELPNNRFKL
jgi:hypothetical protein